MIAAIHQANFIPWQGYFYKIACCDVFVFLDTVQFTKNGYQNRNRIKTAQGIQWLTVPVRISGKFGQLSNEVTIDNHIDWSSKVWKTLQLNYSKAKYFKDYSDYFEDLFTRKWELLGELNTTVLLKIMEWLDLNPKILLASGMKADGKSSELLVNICSELNADIYLSGFGGDKYMDHELFSAKDIIVRTYDFVSPVYPQLFGEFIPNLSIIDLLFNCGPESRNILLSAGQGIRVNQKK